MALINVMEFRSHMRDRRLFGICLFGSSREIISALWERMVPERVRW